MIVESYEDVIILSGSLNHNFWDTIHTAISLTLKRHPTGVIIDCSGLTDCSPQGAETFRSAMEFIQRHDARVILAAVPQNVLEVLKTVPEVRSQLPIVDSVEEARRSLDLLYNEDEGKKKKRIQPLPGSKKVLVCLTAGSADEHLVDVAKNYAVAFGAETMFVYPILVPRDLPLQAPLKEQETAAGLALERAQQVFEEAHLPMTPRVERARDVASAIVAALEDFDAVQVIVAMPDDPNEQDYDMRTVKNVLGRVQKPVMFVRGGVE